MRASPRRQSLPTLEEGGRGCHGVWERTCCRQRDEVERPVFSAIRSDHTRSIPVLRSLPYSSQRAGTRRLGPAPEGWDVRELWAAGGGAAMPGGSGQGPSAFGPLLPEDMTSSLKIFSQPALPVQSWCPMRPCCPVSRWLWKCSCERKTVVLQSFCLRTVKYFIE